MGFDVQIFLCGGEFKSIYPAIKLTIALLSRFKTPLNTANRTLEQGKLYVISTPIGNMDDITLRAMKTLGSVDVLACEDTRVTRKIFQRHEIDFPAKVVSYHEHNEEYAGEKILEMLRNGLIVGLCSDAGTPCISGPGYRVVSAALDGGFKVEVIPGVSAITSALAMAGLPTSSFTYKGFPPRKSGARQRFFELEKELPHTLVFYESPYRVVKSLDDMLFVYGDRLATVCFELTKKFERIHRGYLSVVIEELKTKTIKGEITIVVSGSNPKFLNDDPAVDDSEE